MILICYFVILDSWLQCIQAASQDADAFAVFPYCPTSANIPKQGHWGSS